MGARNLLDQAVGAQQPQFSGHQGRDASLTEPARLLQPLQQFT
jgi:hypothetical protein